MTNIAKPNTFSSSTTISSSEVNANFDTIYNDYNGSIDANNLAANAVTTAKIADLNVTTAKLAAGAVTSTKVSFGGAGAGIWWEEIGRTTLGVAGDSISVASLPVRKYLKVIACMIHSGAVTVGMTMNNDTGAAAYSWRVSYNGAADTGDNSDAAIDIASSSNQVSFLEATILNIAAQEKPVYIIFNQTGAAGAGADTTRGEFSAKWINTSAAISRIDLTNSNTGDFGAGSEIIVLGHD